MSMYMFVSSYGIWFKKICVNNYKQRYIHMPYACMYVYQCKHKYIYIHIRLGFLQVRPSAAVRMYIGIYVCLLYVGLFVHISI